MDSPFHFRAEDNATVWIFNIVQISYFGRSRFFYNLATCVEVASTVLCLAISLLFAVKAVLYPPLHINLVIISLGKLLLVCISFTARLIMVLFEAGLLPVRDFGCHPVPLLNKIRLFWVIGILNYNGPVYLERCAATFFVRDYERNRRIYIAFILIIADVAIIHLIVHIISNAFFNEYAMFFVLWIPSIYFYFANTWLLKSNQKRLDRLNSVFLVRRSYGLRRTQKSKSRDVYTLSLRLQLDENIWCLKQIAAGNLIFIVGVIGTGLLVAVPPLFHYSVESMWILQSFVVFTNMAMPTVSLFVICFLGISLDRFRSLVMPQWALDLLARSKKEAVIDETPHRRMTRVEEEGNIHFSRLADIWESDVRVHM